MANGALKVGTITTSTGSGTITIGQSGETITIPSGVTQTNIGGVMTPAFEANMSADQTVSDDTVTKVQFDTERFDTDSCYDNSTNYRFTPTTAGKYYVYSTIRSDSTSNSTVAQVDIIIYKNGSAYSSAGSNFSTNYIAEHAPTITNVIDFNGSSDYVEIFVRNNATGGTLKVQADTFTSSATFGAYKLIGV